MRRFHLLVILLLATGCSTGDSRDQQAEISWAGESLVLVGAIDNQDTSGEHLLVGPDYMHSLRVDEQGRIAVVDEDRLKVFSADGDAHAILGGPGDGPGEFNDVHSIWDSPDGYYCVSQSPAGFVSHFFEPDGTYLSRRNFLFEGPHQSILQTRSLRGTRPERTYILGEEEYLYSIDVSGEDSQIQSHLYVYLFHESAGEIEVLAEYPQTDLVRFEDGGRSSEFLGTLLMSLLPGNRVAYLHSFLDSGQQDETFKYTITVQSLASSDKSSITHSYSPVSYEALYVPITISPAYEQRNPEGAARRRRQEAEFQEYLKERRYIAPIRELLSDNEYLFAIGFPIGDSTEVLVDVFNSLNGEHITTTVFPETPTLIRDGFAYSIVDYWTTDHVPGVKKFRINPEVYGSSGQ